MRLDDRIAIVTGAATGIGKGIALRFAKEGAHLALVDLNYDALQEVAFEIESMGRQAFALEADVGNLDALANAIERAAEEFTRLDILVNNAAVRCYQPIGSVTEKDWDRQMAVNLKAYFFAAQFVFPYMKRQGKGRIINIASERGHIGVPDASVYCAAKGAVVNLTRQMAVELLPFGIGVVAISPGSIATESHLHRYKDSQKARQAMLDAVPQGRFGTVAEVAAAAAFLASDEGGHIQGTSLVMDGGYLAR